MAIEVELAQEEVKVDPGGSAQVVATIRNTGDHPDQVALEVEGLDTEWCAIPVPFTHLEPGAEVKERILIRPPRSSESRAGVYPFLVRARSLDDGESGLAQANLVINPFSHLTLDINPKRGRTNFFRREALFAVTVSNWGNTDLNLQLFASDPEQECTYEFESERVPLKPGESQVLGLKVQPMKIPVLGSPRLYGFTVSTRAVENPYATANTQGQLERRALISPTLIWIFALLVMGFAVWLFTRPLPVEILEFRADPAQIQEGEKATLSWVVRNATRLIIKPIGGLIVEDITDRRRIDLGTTEVAPTVTTTYQLIAENRYGNRSKEVTITVNRAPLPPPPVILSFTAEPEQVYQGEPVMLRWKVRNATILILTPPGQSLDPATPGFEHKPNRTTTYILIAKNSAGKLVQKSVRVEVLEPSQAQVVLFTASPTEVSPGSLVTLRWEVQGAVKVEIDQGVGEVDPVSGQVELTPQKTTLYTLTATDANGRQVKASVTVKVKQEPPSPLPTNP